MPYRCCAIMCNKIASFQFPKDELLCKKWILAISRKHWKPTQYSRICTDHFLPSDFIDGPTSKVTKGSLIRIRRKLKTDAVPSVFPAHKPQKSKNIDNVRKLRLEKRLENNIKSHVMENESNLDNDLQVEMEIDVTSEETVTNINLVNNSENDPVITPTADLATQVAFRPQPPTLSVEALQYDKPSLHYFTGLEDFSKFQVVFWSLGPAVNHLKYFRTNKVIKISPMNQFLLMLARLRQDLDYFLLSKMCGISIFMAENIFVTWINFCSRQWGEINQWPSRELVKYFAPLDFKNDYPTTRLIIDATEVSSKRIDIERLIGMGKTYKILQNKLKLTETKLAHHIVNICFMLVNFHSNIVEN